jgi:hypothetical protein
MLVTTTSTNASTAHCTIGREAERQNRVSNLWLGDKVERDDCMGRDPGSNGSNWSGRIDVKGKALALRPDEQLRQETQMLTRRPKDQHALRCMMSPVSCDASSCRFAT